MVLNEIDLGPLGDPSSMLWVAGILASLPIVLMVAIAVAVVHGRRVRERSDEEQDPR